MLLGRSGPAVKGIIVPGRNHFDVLAPGTEVIAAAIAKADDLSTSITADAIVAKN